MEYQGQELEAFDKAKIFQKYIFFQIKKYFKNGIFEVGAGLGSFSKEYINDYQDIHLSDLDTQNFKTLKKIFRKKNKDLQEKIQDTSLKYNTIVYLNVLEHIKEDTKEINDW